MAYNIYRDQQKQKTRELQIIKEIQYRATLEFIENNQSDTEQKITLLNQEIDKLPKKCKTVLDRKSTRLNSSHWPISYAVFCLKKKKKKNI